MQQPSNRVMGITVLLIVLALYSLRQTPASVVIDEETSVSLCQVHAQLDGTTVLDDRALLLLLAVLKTHDFQIGQPVWGPADTLLYLCEHRVKTGFKRSVIDKELNNVIKNSGASSKRLTWSCV